MSFSSKAKSEICRTVPKTRCCKISELAALLYTCGTIQFIGKNKVNLKVNTENASIARKVFTLIKSLYNTQPEILVRRNKRLRKNNIYILIVPQVNIAQKILEDTLIMYKDKDNNINFNFMIDSGLISTECCKRSFLRGAFLGGGSVSDPEKAYHLEFVANTKEYGTSLCQLIQSFNLHSKLIERKKNYVVYIKEGEHIVDLLNLIGAHTALLNLENIRIYKDMRNNINRLVNCETANLSKTINASVRQIKKIEYIRDQIGFDKLPPSLKEIAEIRLNHPHASLRELGEMLDPPIGKSGVNHRLRKLEKIAEDKFPDI